MVEKNKSPKLLAQEIANGYATKGEAIKLGSVLVNGEIFPNEEIKIPLSMINRHGLVAGATGTGKTKTLQLLSEKLSKAGVPVVIADMKGDVSGMLKPGTKNEKIESRIKDTNDDNWTASGFPVQFLSLGDQSEAVPLRASINSFGHVLLSKVLGLNETQESTLGLIFGWAKSQNYKLVELKDLKAIISFLVSDAGKVELKNIGGVSASTAGVLLRSIANLEADGGDLFFGEPEWDITDLIRLNENGEGIISLIELAEQAARPRLFSTFLMWVLSSLFTKMPEIGDLDKPKVVFILDEAHLLFSDATKAFKQLVEQTVKLIRSKGVGVFFCSQLPTDIPNTILSQLGARIQHALRAFTPEDQQALSKTVKTYPNSEAYNLEKDLPALGTGEAIITVLSEKGAPTPVSWTRLSSPESSMSALTKEEITKAAKESVLFTKYSNRVSKNDILDSLNQKLENYNSTLNEKKTAGTIPNTTTNKPGKLEQSTVFGDLLNNKESKKFLAKAWDYLYKSIIDKFLGGSSNKKPKK